ncbi:L,D-transpeptidase family protein [Microbulbifer thermotolerans]|uniref:L,D-transpeptidase family protein n=1 Tax=Microbulbifer thermotolerans TaxID=252514 RepID=A0AB35HTG8_MICTH|nr:L,D-transpeptidase family protein [Microbulbifer thermotolerans]MCX2800355.1 L,D-transpeptidase family protein [Microbulbifer thermotolerans]MCX2832152.1 L,D-transpeptidase family protein [Microbulbifer thermotolerans]MCX2834040.1 L,D-transpeptidase family protein [Microbulbifer thermotolerans]MCX2840523.1 L,D-transpeptidase family protein [Microbulbifer thermotolerans]WKT60947.1 L,D-transpeptidase family protein [Microbulbifer thermotolerans]
MRYLTFALLMLAPLFASATVKPVDLVVVYKSKHLMQLVRDERVVKSYRVVFGDNPKGHKVQQGDERTPEGRYTLDWKNPNSRFYRSIHISYPNATDRARARRLGVNPGGAIMIHGIKPQWQHMEKQLQRMNWTDGCIAVTNREMDEIWALVKTPTPIHIYP